jgi:hypothetical protein
LLSQLETAKAEYLFDNWFDPIEASLRDRAREFLQAMFEAELDESLARSRYSRRAKPRAAIRAASAVTAMATGRGRCWGRSAS